MIAPCPTDLTPQEMIRRWIDASAIWSRAIAILRSAADPVYLVGGSIRDALRCVPGHDLDIAVNGSAVQTGRWLADQMQGAFYVMDAEHDVSRVIVLESDNRYHIDLAGLRGDSIRADLCARDLTINAMGMAISPNLQELLDPTGGHADLESGIVRHTHAAAFEDDPVRMLRAVRMSALPGFTLHPATRAVIVSHRPLLAQVSAERLRDELMLMLESSDGSGLRLALDLGLLELLLAKISESKLLAGIAWLDAVNTLADAADGPVSRLATQWQERFSAERSRRQMVSLAALLSPAGTGEQQQALAGLRLAGREKRHVDTVLRAVRDDVWRGIQNVDTLTAHRYYRDFGSAGADGAALNLAEPARTAGEREPARQMLLYWLDFQDQVISPAPLLTAQELMDGLGVEPGPLVGAMLCALSEAQAQGQVQDRDSAWAEARRALAKFRQRKV